MPVMPRKKAGPMPFLEGALNEIMLLQFPWLWSLQQAWNLLVSDVEAYYATIDQISLSEISTPPYRSYQASYVHVRGDDSMAILEIPFDRFEFNANIANHLREIPGAHVYPQHVVIRWSGLQKQFTVYQLVNF